MPNRQLISNQLKMVLEKPASGLEDPLVFFNCQSMRIIVLSNVLNYWHKLLTNDFEYLTQKELVHFEWSDYSFLYGLHYQGQLSFVPDVWSCWALWDFTGSIFKGEVLQSSVEDPG